MVVKEQVRCLLAQLKAKSSKGGYSEFSKPVKGIQSNCCSGVSQQAEYKMPCSRQESMNLKKYLKRYD